MTFVKTFLFTWVSERCNLWANILFSWLETSITYTFLLVNNFLLFIFKRCYPLDSYYTIILLLYCQHINIVFTIFFCAIQTYTDKTRTGQKRISNYIYSSSDLIQLVSNNRTHVSPLYCTTIVEHVFGGLVKTEIIVIFLFYPVSSFTHTLSSKILS